MNSLLQQAEDPAQDLDHLTEEIPEVSHSVFYFQSQIDLEKQLCPKRLLGFSQSFAMFLVLFV